MYTFIRAIAVLNGHNQRWKEVDISATPANLLFIKYRQIYAVLSHTTIVGELTLELSKISPQLQLYQGTISDYLSSIGNAALPTVPGSPVIVRNTAVFSDAYEADYDVVPADYMLGEGVEVPEEDKPHLLITRNADAQPVDYRQFQKRVLANVNGFYHSSTADSRGFYVQRGHDTIMRSGKPHVGLLSFATLGDLEYLSLESPDMQFDLRPGTDEVERIYLKFDKDAFKDKTPLLVLGGYMVTVDGDTLQNNVEGVLTFKTRKYPMIERFFESRSALDYSDFPIRRDAENPDWFEVASFKTEAFWRRLFTANYSYVLLINSADVAFEKIYPEVQTVPHTYMSYQYPKWPLVVCEGKHEIYWNQYEDKSWVLTCGDAYKRKYIFQTSGGRQLVAVDPALVLADAGRYSPAYFLKITSEKIEIRMT